MSTITKTILAICVSAFSFMHVEAQNYNYKDKLKENSERYLSGAVPEVDNKVVFSETIHTNHTADQIIKIVENWAADKSKTDDKFYDSKTIYNDTLKHELVLFVNDRLIFTNQALNLDYTLVSYYLIFEASNNKCVVTLKNIKYKYADFKDQVTADETISDEVALNKEKTKMYRTYDKFRVTTVDMADQIFDEIEKYLNEDQYNAIKNASKLRRESNVAAQVTQPTAEDEVFEKQPDPSKLEYAVEIARPKEVRMTPLVPATKASTNKVVLATQATMNELARQKAFALTNFFIVGENMPYVKQVTAISVTETDGKATIVCYLNNHGTMLSQSQIMPSAKFKILYFTHNYGSYNQLVELSRKYANDEAYTDADINMIEVLLENSKDSFSINHLKIETLPTNTVANNPTIANMPSVGNFIKTDKCVVITGDLIN